MRQGISYQEAVRLAKERLGEATTEAMAAYIQESFGLSIKPVFVTVLLGTLQERALLDLSGRAAYEKIERWKAENPEEAKKAAAAVKRREAARRRKAEAGDKAEPITPVTPGEGPADPPAQAPPDRNEATSSEGPGRGKAVAELPGM